VVNGCCWLNHSGGQNADPRTTRKFIEVVRANRCIKGWFSGHFHLSHDYQDSITFPTIPREEGPYPNRGSCVFVQTGVIRGGCSRDGRRQSRLLRGNKVRIGLYKRFCSRLSFLWVNPTGWRGQPSTTHIYI